MHVDRLATHHKPDPEVRCNARERLDDLVGKLTRWAEDQSTDTTSLSPFVLLRQRDNQRNAKGGRLTRPRLGNPQHVAFLHRVWDCFFLNRGWLR